MTPKAKDYQNFTPISSISDDDEDEALELQDSTVAVDNDPVWKIPDPVDPKQTLLLPPSGIYYMNSRGNQIHVRCHIPSNMEIKAVVFFAHGYSAHINRRWCSVRLFELLKSKGIAVIAHDHENHGYSGGSTRMYVRDVQNLVDDWIGIIQAVRCGDAKTFSQKFGSGIVKNNKTASRLAEAPFFLMGMSMGGLITQLTLQRMKQEHQSLPHGLTFLCPLLSLPVRIHPIVFWIIFVLTFLLHGFSIPTFITGEGGGAALASTDEGRRRLDVDLACGLGTDGGIQLGTVLAFIHAVSQVRLEESAEMEIPVLALHDPEDVFVPYKCTEDLVAAAAVARTPKNSNVEVVPCPDQTHNLLHSRDTDLTEFVEVYEKWMKKSLEASTRGRKVGKVTEQ